ncbi:MAG TPA: LacI family DNA-binding transcriptional regulator [Tepidisphaeraceae bacterium]|nr:LacI family DNA-binding transcriptional regulator [Tepidisphaeraceae bacterium]
MATLEEIARRVGVSRNTVARALSARTKGKWKTTAHRLAAIRKVAEEVGYRPNTAAKATATGRFHTGALLTRASQVDFLPFDLLRGIADAFAAHEMHTMIARLDAHRIADPTMAPKLIRELSVDGLIVHQAIDVPHPDIELLRRYRIPTIWLNTKSSHDAVYPDEFDAGRRATEHLIAMGHRRIAFIQFDVGWGHPGTHYSGVDRQAGYLAAVEAASLQPHVVAHTYELAAQDVHLGLMPWGSPADDRVRRLIALMSATDRPTAVVARGSDGAVPALLAAGAVGLAVPLDLSLISFNHEPLAECGAPLTTMRTPMLTSARTAVDMLVKKIERPTARLRSVAIPYPHPIGGTCAAPPGR